MKKTYLLIAGLVAIILVLAVALVRSNRPNAPAEITVVSNVPAKDATGAAPTGQTLTVKITGDVPSAGLVYRRGSSTPITQDKIDLPYEAVFNVKPLEFFEFASSVPGSATKNIESNLQITVYFNNQLVTTAKEGNVLPGVAQAVFTTPST